MTIEKQVAQIAEDVKALKENPVGIDTAAITAAVTAAVAPLQEQVTALSAKVDTVLADISDPADAPQEPQPTENPTA